MAYTVKPGDNWFKIAQKVFGDQRFAARLADRNPGVTLSPGVRIKTGGIDVSRIGGGAALAAQTAGMSLIGVPGEQISTGIPGQVPITTAVTEEVLGVTPTGQRPPAELAPQAQMVGPEQLVAPVVTPTFGEPITLAGLAAGIGPQPPAPGLGVAGPYGRPPPVAAVAGEPVLGEIGIAGPFGRSPVTPTMAPTPPAEPFVTIGEGVAGPFGRAPIRPTIAPPGAEYVIPTPAERDTTIMPTGQYVSGRVAIAQAATWSARAVKEYFDSGGNRNFLPNVMTSPVATLVLSVEMETFDGEPINTLRELFSDDALSYTEIEPGVWMKNPEITYSGGYGGSIGYTGRRYGRGRGVRGGRVAGAGGTQYGPRLVQWRIAGFG